MFAFNVNDLELMEGWVERDPTMRGRFTFPLTAAQGAAGSSVIYFEIDPGDKLLRHTHSAEEILLVLQGQAQVEVYGERAEASPGSVVLVPSNAPHAAENTGSETLKVVGFFAAAALVPTYEAPIQPFGMDILVTPQPEEAIAATGMRAASAA
jgi:quercetin dioxygenase-like cupin family protein